MKDRFKRGFSVLFLKLKARVTLTSDGKMNLIFLQTLFGWTSSERSFGQSNLKKFLLMDLIQFPSIMFLALLILAQLLSSFLIGSLNKLEILSSKT